MVERPILYRPSYAEARAMAARERAVLLRRIAGLIRSVIGRWFARAAQRGRSTVPSKAKTRSPC